MFSIIQNGFGKRPQATDTVKVYYTGTLINGVVFDGTSPGLPATFKVNEVIPGWIEALQTHARRRSLAVGDPVQSGYGARGTGDGRSRPIRCWSSTSS